MKKLIITIIIVLALAVSVNAYKITNGKISLDNSDIASIMNDYGGSVQGYLAHINTRPINALSIAAPAGCTNCTCSATNPSEDIEVKGYVNAQYLYLGAPVIVNFSDVCKKDLGFVNATGVIKVNCDGSLVCNFPKFTLYDCPNKDCSNGTCTRATIPEFGIIAGAIALIGAAAILMHRRK